MDFQLVVIRGRSASTAIKLPDGVVTAGRQDDCEVRIKSSQVSRKHCQLFEKHGMLLVKDLGSSNGTFVNGKKVEGQRVMEPGDELGIGPIVFRVEKIGQPLPDKPETPSGAKKASDTAIAEAVPLADAVEVGGDDDFEIDFDEEPVVTSPSDDFDLDFGDDDAAALLSNPAEKTPEPAAPAAPTKPAAKKKEEEAPLPTAPAEQAGSGDEAVADFLFGIKLDDDE